MKRVSLFCGHYGSGKTNLAVNYARFLRKQGLDVSIADLDVVNPYFRTKDSEQELTAAGIHVISLPFANSSVDLPSLPSEAYGLVQRRDTYAVLDIGGDDRGAYALGRFVPYILAEDNYDMFYVVNFSRPLTRTPQEALEVMQEIRDACGIPFTGIINNTNLGAETTPALLEASCAQAQELARLSGVPLAFTSAEAGVAENCRLEQLFPMELQAKYW